MAFLAIGTCLARAGRFAATSARQHGIVFSRQRVKPLASAIAGRLPADLVAHVLSLVPGPPRVVWSTAHDTMVLLPGWGTPHRLQRLAEIVTTSARFIPQGRLVTAESDGTAIVWDAASGRSVLELRTGAPQLFGVEVLPGGHAVAALGSDGCVVVWSLSSGEVLQRMTLPGAHRALRVLDNDRLPPHYTISLLPLSRRGRAWSLATRTKGLCFSRTLAVAEFPKDTRSRKWPLLR